MMRLFLGGISFALRLPASVGFDVRGYEAFVTPDTGAAGVRIDAHAGEPPRDWIAAFWTGELLMNDGRWAIVRTEDRNWPLLFGPSPTRSDDRLPAFFLRATHDFGEIVAYLGDARSVAGLLYPLDILLVRHVFAARKAILLHSAGVVVDGRAHVFVADSGKGKSTLARVFAERFGPDCILADDRCVLHRDDGGYRVFGTPWGTRGVGRPGGVPLERIWSLEPSPHNRMRGLDRIETTLALMRSYEGVSWLDELGPGQAERLQRLASEAGLRFSELGFVRDPSAVEFIARAG